MVQRFSALYGLIVVWLNNTENWRTDAEYSNAYIAKHFVFMAFNSYVALIYIAFIEGAACAPRGAGAPRRPRRC